jgi:hypothetical protein
MAIIVRKAGAMTVTRVAFIHIPVSERIMGFYSQNIYAMAAKVIKPSWISRAIDGSAFSV